MSTRTMAVTTFVCDVCGVTRRRATRATRAVSPSAFPFVTPPKDWYVAAYQKRLSHGCHTCAPEVRAYDEAVREHDERRDKEEEKRYTATAVALAEWEAANPTPEWSKKSHEKSPKKA